MIGSFHAVFPDAIQDGALLRVSSLVSVYTFGFSLFTLEIHVYGCRTSP